MQALVRRLAVVVAACAAFACLGLLAPLPARAAGVVTNCNNSDSGSLRAAIAGGGAVTFQAGLNCTGATAITLTPANGTLTIAADTTIDATGHAIVVDGGNAVTVFTITGGTVQLAGMTVQHGKGVNGFTPPDGGLLHDGGDGGTGGIKNAGTLTLTNVTVSGNTGGHGGRGGGGGISNQGTLTLASVTLTGNTGGTGGNGSAAPIIPGTGGPPGGPNSMPGSRPTGGSPGSPNPLPQPRSG